MTRNKAPRLPATGGSGKERAPNRQGAGPEHDPLVLTSRGPTRPRRLNALVHVAQGLDDEPWPSGRREASGLPLAIHATALQWVTVQDPAPILVTGQAAWDVWCIPDAHIVHHWQRASRRSPAWFSHLGSLTRFLLKHKSLRPGPLPGRHSRADGAASPESAESRSRQATK